MEKKFVEVTLNEKAIAMECSNGCLRSQGSPTGG